MKYHSTIFFLSLVCMFMNSCITKNNEPILKTTKYEDGSIQSEQYFLNDSIKEGTFKTFYRSGKLEIEVPYHNNKKHGRVIKYYENGRVAFKYNFVDGVQEGVALVYFDNGQISTKANIHNGNKIGGNFFYNKDGSSKLYQGNGFDGNPKFSIEYFEDGKIKNARGNGIIDVATNKTEFHKGDTLKATFLIALPDQSIGEFYIDDDLTKQINLPIDTATNTVQFIKIFKDIGTYKWKASYSLKFNDRTVNKYQYVLVSNVK